MRAFRVYKHSTRRFEAVKLGFSWPALFFGGFWILHKKLWGRAAIWFVAFLFLRGLDEELSEQVALDSVTMIASLMLVAGYLVLCLIPAFKGNGWGSRNLEKRGFELVHTAQAETPEAAIA